MNAKTVCLDLSVFDVDGDPRRNLIAKGWTPPAAVEGAQGASGGDGSFSGPVLAALKDAYEHGKRGEIFPLERCTARICEAIRKFTPPPATGSGGGRAE